MIDIILRVINVCSLLISGWLGFSAYRLNRQSKEILLEIVRSLARNVGR